jgi:23S rRNA pseudouridine1911/1915/1917 synthase
LEKYPEAKDVGEPIQLTKGGSITRPGIVHRIDRDTSGVLILAKNAKAHAHLKEQFQNRDVEKTYRAFVYGEMKEKEGTVDRPIGRSKKDFRLWSAQRGARGEMREAVTNYKVLLTKDGYSYVEVNPKTGRTHQIRVHFKAINHPVVADSMYAPGHQPGLGFKRLALHAYEAGFHNLEGKWVELEAPLPLDFEKALEMLKKA